MEKNREAEFMISKVFNSTHQIESEYAIDALNRLYQYCPFLPSYLQRNFLNDLKMIAIDYKFSLLFKLNMINDLLLRIREREVTIYRANNQSYVCDKFPFTQNPSNTFHQDQNIRMKNDFEHKNIMNEKFCSKDINNLQTLQTYGEKPKNMNESTDKNENQFNEFP